MKTLLEMLRYRRPAYSETEERFLDTFFRPLSKHANVSDFDEDSAGNLIFVVRGGSRTLFAAHADTVHRSEGMLKLHMHRGRVTAKSGILGADDAVGCFLLREIIEAGIPSACIITRGEEIGGIGSKHLAPRLAGFDRAIAFDRRGTKSIITHQGGGRCCSDVFAASLATALNTTNPRFRFAPDHTGIYCDIAEFVEAVPECTNISCGYFNEHTGFEYASLPFIEALRESVLSLPWESLPVIRTPAPRWSFDDVDDIDWEEDDDETESGTCRDKVEQEGPASAC